MNRAWGKQGRSLRAMVLIALVGVFAGALAGTGAQPAVAVSGGLFDPGLIISDPEFFDYQSMSEGDLQNWFNNQPCSSRDGAPCLRDFTQTTFDRPAAGTGHCTAYAGGTNESAARILAKVAQACRINPKVLIVLLQKEQSLVSSPSTSGYRFATGWGCPDTAPCDQTQVGFYSQVYKSAWQFRQYTLTPNSWNYRKGINSVRYSPNPDCGASDINIQSQATANLYNYTPYQPNAAALANMYGSGDECSAYGNRNFWRIYYDWFGSPTDRSPMGQMENMQVLPGGIGIWGWALDTDTSAAVNVAVSVDGGIVQTTSADLVRSDIDLRYGFGANHGFALTVPVRSGNHRICMSAINVGAGVDKALGCWNITLQGQPVGAIDNMQPQPGGVGVWGWAVDPDTVDPILVHFYVDGVMILGTVAANPRGDMASLKPGYGLNHGFGVSLPAAPGRHTICAYAINANAGDPNTTLGCYTVLISGDPAGALDKATSGLGSINASGWAVDPDVSGPVSVRMLVDGTPAGDYVANAARTDMGTYMSYGSNHGFSARIPASAGVHNVCAIMLNSGSGANVALPCQSVEVGGSPKGAIENAQNGFGNVSIWGWAFDPDTVDPILVHVYVDGVMKGGFPATQAKAVSAIPSEYGSSHGFGVTVPLAAGKHDVCVYGINVGYGQVVQLGCFTTVMSGDPVGVVENIQAVGPNFGVWGYALDPDTTGSILVHAYLDGVMAGGFGATVPRSDIGLKYPGYGDNHGYGFEIPASPGSHQLCIYSINQGAGSNVIQWCGVVIHP